MSKHVNHLLSSYVAGQLTARESARVIAHLNDCVACQASLRRYENMSRSLDDVLTIGGFVQATALDNWWQKIEQRPPIKPLRTVVNLKLVPILLSLSLIVSLPFAVHPAWLNSVNRAATTLQPSPKADFRLVPSESVSNTISPGTSVSFVSASLISTPASTTQDEPESLPRQLPPIPTPPPEP